MIIGHERNNSLSKRYKTTLIWFARQRCRPRQGWADSAIAGWHFLDRRGQRGLDESGEGGFHADRRRLLALKCHAKNSTPLKNAPFRMRDK
jgi:hypothetical protein